MKSQKKKTRNQPAASKAMRRSPMKGVVISRKCSSCEHHEIGIITEAGDFMALKPGMKIAVLEGEKEDEKGVGDRERKRTNSTTFFRVL